MSEWTKRTNRLNRSAEETKAADGRGERMDGMRLRREVVVAEMSDQRGWWRPMSIRPGTARAHIAAAFLR